LIRPATPDHILVSRKWSELLANPSALFISGCAPVHESHHILTDTVGEEGFGGQALAAETVADSFHILSDFQYSDVVAD